MNDEKIILEINPRTKEKKTVKITELELSDGYTVGDLVEEHQHLIKEVEHLNILTDKLIKYVTSLAKSTQVQIADIKEEIK